MPTGLDTNSTRLGITELRSALEDFLDPVLSSRRTADLPAENLTSLFREDQDFALHWTDVIRRSNAEMAYQFVSRVPQP